MQQRQPAKIDHRLYYLDVLELERARGDAGKTQRECVKGLAELEMDISWSRVQAAFRGEGVFPSIAKRIADHVGRKVTELLAVYDPRYKPSAEVKASLVESEWEVAEYDGPGVVASNGLHYFVCWLENKHVTGRRARGKFYHLSYLSTTEREKQAARLLRHPIFLDRIGAHPNLAVNLSAPPVAGGDAWWVIDQWVGSRKLADLLESAPLPAKDVRRLLMDVAQGLEALHRAEVVFRELTPSRVLIADRDGRGVLTDLELATLFEAGPSGEWPDDVYRAPEVEVGSADARSDLYSWARIFVHAATGQRPSNEQGADKPTNPGLPAAVWRLVTKCLAKGPSCPSGERAGRSSGASGVVPMIKRVGRRYCAP